MITKTGLKLFGMQLYEDTKLRKNVVKILNENNVIIIDNINVNPKLKEE